MPNKVSENRKKKMINGFTMFLEEKHNEYLRKNIPCSKSDIVGSVRAEWNNKPKPDQARYENQAKLRKAQLLADDRLKCDSFGRVIADVKAEAAAKDAERARKKKRAFGIVEEALLQGQFASRAYVLVHFNILCETKDTPPKFVPCEIGAVKFSLEKGIITYYHSLINPGEVPMGYAADIKENTEKTHQLQRSDLEGYTNYLNVRLNLASLLETQKGSGVYDPLFVLEDHMDRTLDILSFIQEKARTLQNEKMPFDVVYLEDLMRHVIDNRSSYMKSVGKKGVQGIIPDGAVKEALTSSKHDYSFFTSCPFHEENGIQVHCALGYVIHRALLICELLCPLLEIEMRQGRHRPPIITAKKPTVEPSWKKHAAEKPTLCEWELEDSTPEGATGACGGAASTSIELELEGAVGCATTRASMFDVDAEYRKEEEDEDDEWEVTPTRRTRGRGRGWTHDVRRALPE